jgi:translation initiation factor IF-2
MKKIRINELARELEVKAHEILDRLPELGVAEKKTHSSSIDEDVAIKLRRLYGFDVPDLAPETESERAEEMTHETAVAVAEPPEAGPVSRRSRPPRKSRRLRPVHRRRRPSKRRGQLPGLPLPSVRHWPGRPIHPPVLAHGAVRPEAPRPAAPPSAPPSVAAQAPSLTPPVAVIAPGRPAPPAAKPLPGPATSAPRPGQVLSGPRQPFPSAAAPSEGARVSGPGAPMPGAATRPAIIQRQRPEVRPGSSGTIGAASQFAGGRAVSDAFGASACRAAGGAAGGASAARSGHQAG